MGHVLVYHFKSTSISFKFKRSIPDVLADPTDTCVMLSDKAKGKQRAVELPSSVADSQSPGIPLDSTGGQAPTRDLVVRFTEGLPDLIVPVNQQDAVRDVKTKVNK
jgi:hypothetical protein